MKPPRKQRQAAFTKAVKSGEKDKYKKMSKTDTTLDYKERNTAATIRNIVGETPKKRRELKKESGLSRKKRIDLALNRVGSEIKTEKKRKYVRGVVPTKTGKVTRKIARGAKNFAGNIFAPAAEKTTTRCSKGACKTPPMGGK